MASIDAGSGYFSNTYRIQWADGTIVMVRANYQVITDEDGSVRYLKARRKNCCPLIICRSIRAPCFRDGNVSHSVIRDLILFLACILNGPPVTMVPLTFHPRRLVGTLTDITELWRMQQAKEEHLLLKKSLEEVTKRRFTPLQSVFVIVGVLQGSVLPLN